MSMKKRKTIAGSLPLAGFLLAGILLVSMCTRDSPPAGIEKDPDTTRQWAGDHPADFKAEGLNVSSAGSGIYPRVPYEERRVGIAYTTWHRNEMWQPESVWTFPQLGKYLSDNREVIRQHAEWLAGAGVDFIWIDWSNNLDYEVSMEQVLTDNVRPDFAMIERSTLFIFEEYSKMRAEGKKTPNISIFIGNPDPNQRTGVSDGRLTRKADQVERWFVNNADHPEYRDLLELYKGKPLLVSYAGTPTPWQESVPPWDDSRFTVRFMTGYVTEQSALFDSKTREGKYWSWEERGAQTFTVDEGLPEAMTVVASWRPQSTEGKSDYIPAGKREGGKTFKEQWARARLLGVRFAMVGTWNEYVTGEQHSAEVSKDIEPNAIWGDQYLQLLQEEIRRFKGE